jgi:DNA-binding transcriptional MerR regulator
LIITGKQAGEISIREAARTYGVPATTISGWYKSGLLSGRRSGQYVLVNVKQLLQIKIRWQKYLQTYGHARGFRVGKKPRP